MNKNLLALFLVLCVCVAPRPILAQVSGNIAYSKQRKASQGIRQHAHQVYLNDSSLIIQARVLLNAPADAWVAVLGIQDEGGDPNDCRAKMQLGLDMFLKELQAMGFKEEDYYVDFVTQNRIYDYEVSGSVAYERLSGFELKKNLSIRLKSEKQIEEIMIKAAEVGIYDLIKVDYLIQDLSTIKKRLFEEAMQVIEDKKRRYVQKTALKLAERCQVYLENYGSQAPAQAYSSYQAYESGNANTSHYSSKVRARKMSTFFYDPIGMGSYDKVIEPVLLKPALQFTYELQMKYDILN